MNKTCFNSRMKTRGNKLGFTLIEMITGLAVLAIILTIVPVVFVQTIRINDEVINLGQLEVIALESMSELLDDLRKAKAVDASDPAVLTVTTDSYTANYSVDPTTNILMREYDGAETPGANEVLAEGFYMGYTMELSWAESGNAADKDYIVTLNLTINESNGTSVFDEEYAIRPTYLNANG